MHAPAFGLLVAASGLAFVFVKDAQGQTRIPHAENANRGACVIGKLGTGHFRHGALVGGIQSLTASPDGKFLASVGGWPNFKVCLWNAAEGNKIRVFADSKTPGLMKVLFSRSGMLVCARYESKVLIWQRDTGKLFQQVAIEKDGGKVCCMDLTAKEDTLVAGHADGTITLLSVASGKKQRTFKMDVKALLGIALLQNDNVLAGLSSNGILVFYDTLSGNELSRLQLPKQAASKLQLEWCLVPSADRALLAVVGAGPVLLVDGKQRKVTRTLTAPFPLTTFAISPTGKRGVSIDLKEELCFWDLENGKPLEKMCFQFLDRLGNVTFIRGGKAVAVSSSRGTIGIVDAEKAQEVPTSGHYAEVYALTFSPDGRTLISGGNDGAVRFWNVATRQEESVSRVSGEVCSIRISPNGKLMVVMTDDLHELERYKVSLFDNQTRKLYATVLSTKTRPTRLTFSPDGKFLAVLLENGSLRLWDVLKKKERDLSSVPDLFFGFGPLLFSPDNTCLVLGKESKGVCFLDWQRDKVIKSRQFKLDSLSAWTFLTKTRLALFQNQLSDASGLAEVRIIHANPEIKDHIFPCETNLTQEWTVSLDGTILATGIVNGRIDLVEIATGQLFRELLGPTHLCRLSLSPDGRYLAASSGQDFTIWLFDLAKVSARTEKLSPTLSREELLAGWKTLLKGHASEADKVMWKFVATSDQAVGFFREVLKPIPKTDRPTIKALINNLGDNKFAVRTKAFLALEKLGDVCEGELSTSLKADVSPEACLRIGELLERIKTSKETVRVVRSIRILELIGTEEGRVLLKQLAGGEPTARLTEQSICALDRLAALSAPTVEPKLD